MLLLGGRPQWSQSERALALRVVGAMGKTIQERQAWLAAVKSDLQASAVVEQGQCGIQHIMYISCVHIVYTA